MKTKSILIALISIGALGAAGFSAPRTVTPPQLLGCTPEAVIAAFGVPTGVQAGAATFEFTYVGADGEEGRFVFCGEAAVMVPADDFRPAAIMAAKPGEAYAGQRAGDAAACMGNAEGISNGTTSSILEYADGRTLTLMHGRAWPGQGR